MDGQKQAMQVNIYSNGEAYNLVVSHKGKDRFRLLSNDLAVVTDLAKAMLAANRTDCVVSFEAMVS